MPHQTHLRMLRMLTIACLQVGYCQGMAFVAGIILMYLPEEPAYRSALSAAHAGLLRWPSGRVHFVARFACRLLKQALLGTTLSMQRLIVHTQSLRSSQHSGRHMLTALKCSTGRSFRCTAAC